MNRLFLAFYFLIIPLISIAQNQNFAISTSPIGGRFEIIQSPITHNLTFRLDKYTGEVYRYAIAKNSTTDKNEPVWQKIENPQLDIINMGRKEKEIRFQLFMGGMSFWDCYLLDIKTGMTFFLCKIKESGELWFKYMRDSYVVDEEQNKDVTK